MRAPGLVIEPGKRYRDYSGGIWFDPVKDDVGCWFLTSQRDACRKRFFPDGRNWSAPGSGEDLVLQIEETDTEKTEGRPPRDLVEAGICERPMPFAPPVNGTTRRLYDVFLRAMLEHPSSPPAPPPAGETRSATGTEYADREPSRWQTMLAAPLEVVALGVWITFIVAFLAGFTLGLAL